MHGERTRVRREQPDSDPSYGVPLPSADVELARKKSSRKGQAQHTIDYDWEIRTGRILATFQRGSTKIECVT